MKKAKKSPSVKPAALKKPNSNKKLAVKEKKTEKVDLNSVIKKKTDELLEKVGFPCPVTITAAEGGRYLIKLESEDPNLLIGYHGQTLSALQLILSLGIQKDTSLWVPITLDVGDYRERREEQLRRLALSVAQRVRFSGQPQTLSRLTAAERRIVHLTLSEDEMVETISEGEGQDRHLVIRPKVKS